MVIEGNCACDKCRNRMAFNMPKEIVEATRTGELVIFAGAGVSTESKTAFPLTLYEQIKRELDSNENLSFSELMSLYCKRSNGRIELLRKIKQRLDYVRSFPELERRVSSFHRELSSLHQIDTIVTTNWDDLFERYCGAIPIVFPEDFIFSNQPERKVLKIHGSINNLGSLVVTEEDYARCFNDLSTGLVGSYLKTLLATRTILFVGYSFGDEDFNRLHTSLFKEMGDLMPHAYLVTLDESMVRNPKNEYITPILTDATYFITELKKIMMENGEVLKDNIFDDVALMLQLVVDKHSELAATIKAKEHPQVIFALSYQDGVIHAFERILSLRWTGYYSDFCNIKHTTLSYEKIRREKLENKLYYDVAYIDGYMNGMTFLMGNADFNENFHLYYLFGYEYAIQTLHGFQKLINQGPELHTDSYNYALKVIEEIDDDADGTVFHHTPFL